MWWHFHWFVYQHFTLLKFAKGWNITLSKIWYFLSNEEKLTLIIVTCNVDKDRWVAFWYLHVLSLKNDPLMVNIMVTWKVIRLVILLLYGLLFYGQWISYFFMFCFTVINTVLIAITLRKISFFSIYPASTNLWCLIICYIPPHITQKPTF